MKSHLVAIEQKALNFRNAGRLQEAAALFLEIIKEQPDWEHGGGFYDLACCYEDLGQLVEAEECFRKALNFGPGNPYFLGGYASFLYLHGDPKIAFDAHIKLFQVESQMKDEKGMEKTMSALKALAKKIGWSDQVISEKIKEITK